MCAHGCPHVRYLTCQRHVFCTKCTQLCAHTCALICKSMHFCGKNVKTVTYLRHKSVNVVVLTCSNLCQKPFYILNTRKKNSSLFAATLQKINALAHFLHTKTVPNSHIHIHNTNEHKIRANSYELIRPCFGST